MGKAMGNGSSTTRQRPGLRPWRDPRLIVGSALVVGSMVLGGLALAAADHTEAYWATKSGVRAGDVVRRSDFIVVKAKVPDRTAATLIRTNAALPQRLGSMRWSESLPGGTLISSSHLVGRQRVVEVPVTVSSGGVPTGLHRGDVVDVWVSSGDRDASTAPKAVKVLSRVHVVSRSSSAGYDGGSAVTVVVDAAGTPVAGPLIAAVSTGRVVLVRVS